MSRAPSTPEQSQPTESKSLGELYPIEQARCRELQQHYKAIGPGGSFGYAMIELTLKRADQAAISGDVVAMLRCYEEMKDCQ